MSARSLARLAIVLGVGLLLIAVAARFRKSTLVADPCRRLPTRELLVALRGDDLTQQLRALAGFPVYHGLLDGAESALPPVRPPRSRPSFWPALPAAGPSALGLYTTGWIAVTPATAETPDGPNSVRDGDWRLAASDSSLLPGHDAARFRPSRPGGLDRLLVHVDLARWLSPSDRGDRARRGWRAWLPARAGGEIDASPSKLHEIWSFETGERCVLDLLSPDGRSDVDARGWSALPPDAPTVAWFTLDTDALRGDIAKLEDGPLNRLSQLETFLGFPFRAEIAESLAGPGLAALLAWDSDASPRLLLAFDLAHPEKAKRAIDRFTGLGVLSGAISERAYRGTSIASWRSARSRGAPELSAAVDADVLLLSSTRRDLEAALDRRRDPARAARASLLRSRLERLGTGSWKSSNQSTRIVRAWEDLTGSKAWSTPAPDVRAVLRRRKSTWWLESRGNAPAICADATLPALRELARSRLVSEGP